MNEPNFASSTQAASGAVAATVPPGPVVRRRRSLPRPGQRDALRALQSVRALLVGALGVAALGWVLLIFSLVAGRGAPTELLIVVAMALPLGLGAWHFTAKPLVVRRWLLRGVIAAGCVVISLVASPLTQLYLALLSAATIAAWYLPSKRLMIRKWMYGVAAAGCYGFQYHRNATLGFLSICWLILLGLLGERDGTRRAIDEYQEHGGKIENLYDAASPEGKRLVSPAAVIIFVLVLAFGVAGLWSVSNAASAMRSQSGTLGIGGGR